MCSDVKSVVSFWALKESQKVKACLEEAFITWSTAAVSELLHVFDFFHTDGLLTDDVLTVWAEAEGQPAGLGFLAVLP